MMERGTIPNRAFRWEQSTLAEQHGVRTSSINEHETQPTVLLALGDDAVRLALEQNFLQEGYAIFTAADGDAALATVEHRRLSLILLDLHLPGHDGLEICRLIRTRRDIAQLPIMMFSAYEDEIEAVIALEVGADDYVPQPVRWNLLRARIRALLRRYHYVQDISSRLSSEEEYTSMIVKPEQTRRMIIGNLEIDIAGRAVKRNGLTLELSTRLFDLLVYFTRHRDMVLSRKRLLHQLQTEGTIVGDERLIDAYIHWLREKIEDDPAHPQRIQTVRGVGYRFA